MKILSKKKEIIVLYKEGEFIAVCSEAGGSAYSRGLESTATYSRDIHFGCYQCGADLMQAFPSEKAAFNFTSTIDKKNKT